MIAILTGAILQANIEGPITPVTADYVERVFKKAEEGDYSHVLIIINTPGGLESAMRRIVKEILNSPVPVITYVYPQGSRAASAGVFITLAGDVVAMAEGTNMGSASPVSLMGPMDSVMQKKVMNDLKAFLISILEKKNRPTFWADSFVVHARSYSARELKKYGLIDYIANSVEELLDSVGIQDRSMERVDKSTREKVLEKIADPNIAYFLLLIGLYGIIFELANPGFGVSGTIGAISLILALFALQVLSASMAGVLLIILGFVFFFVEIKLQSHGLFGLAGVVSFLMGSFMLYSSSPQGIGLSPVSIWVATGLTLFFFFVVVALAIRALRLRPSTGKEGMIGEEGEVIEDFDGKGEGRVMVHGEIWWAKSDRPLKKGEKVVVVDVRGLKLKVEKLEENTEV